MTARYNAQQLAMAGRIAHAMADRAAMSEAVGIMRSWHRCDTAQARQNLADNSGADGQDAEAARVAAIVDAQADGRTDPDWD
jgi:hypothetical protein